MNKIIFLRSCKCENAEIYSVTFPFYLHPCTLEIFFATSKFLVTNAYNVVNYTELIEKLFCAISDSAIKFLIERINLEVLPDVL